MSNLKDFRDWEKVQLHRFQRDDERVYLAVGYNDCYGKYIVRFQIGDEAHATTVRDKHLRGFIACSEHGGLSSERPFERGSVTYEFLYKPLGLSDKGVPSTGFKGCHKLFSDYWFVKNQLESKGFQEF